LYQGAGKVGDYPKAVADWKKERATQATDLAKAGISAQSHLEAARIAGQAATAEARSPEKVAEAEKARQAEAERQGAGHATHVKNYLTSRGAFDSTGKATNEAISRDATAAMEVARRHPVAGEGGKAGIAHFDERQDIRNYLVKNPQKTPIGYDVDRYMTQMAQDPAAWQVRLGEARELSEKPVAKKGVISPGKWYEYQKKPTDLTPAWMKPPKQPPPAM
jgi:hypothetical protein